MHYFGGIIKDRYNCQTNELLFEKTFLEEKTGKKETERKWIYTASNLAGRTGAVSAGIKATGGTLR